jgi:hypothetical protein
MRYLLFYLSVDGLTRFNGYQPIKRHEGIYTGKMPRPFLSGFSPSLGDPQNAMVCLSTHLLIYFLARAFLIMPTSAERLLARQKQKNSDTA